MLSSTPFFNTPPSLIVLIENLKKISNAKILNIFSLEITESQDDVILNKDYIYDSDSDTNFTSGVIISKNN